MLARTVRAFVDQVSWQYEMNHMIWTEWYGPWYMWPFSFERDGWTRRLRPRLRGRTSRLGRNKDSESTSKMKLLLLTKNRRFRVFAVKAVFSSFACWSVSGDSCSFSIAVVDDWSAWKSVYFCLIARSKKLTPRARVKVTNDHIDMIILESNIWLIY